MTENGLDTIYTKETTNKEYLFSFQKKVNLNK